MESTEFTSQTAPAADKVPEGSAPEGSAPEDNIPEELPVRLTDKAVTMVKITREQEGIDDNYGLRVAVRGGGCSGFEYALDFEEGPRDTDWVYPQGDLRVMVDPVSARYLAGTEIDYVLGTTGAGFKFNNPKAVGSCGCGSSFSV